MIQVNLNPQSATQRWQDSSKAWSKEGGVGGSPMAGMIFSLAYEFTPLAKPSQAAFHGQYPVEWALLSES